MGFYTPATLIKDAQRHGVTVEAIDAAHSDWFCTLESHPRNAEEAALERIAPRVRIGLRYVHGLREETAAILMQQRERKPLDNLSDLVRRVPFQRPELDTLAELGALASLKGAAPRRRAALWQVAAVERDPSSLFAGQVAGEDGTAKVADASPLPEMSEMDNTLADYRLSGLTTGPQLLAHMRGQLRARGILDASQMKQVPNGKYVHTAGHVIVRQRPGSAKGFLFLTLEDETGTSNAVLTPAQFKRFRAPLHLAAVIEIAGPVQNVDGVIHLRVKELKPLRLKGGLPSSHDYAR
jgi:error-prone DNA polymerase